MTNPSSLGVLTLGGFLLGNRRVTGQIVQVGDDAGQHPEHTGSIERDVLRLGIGLGPQVHHDPLSAVQAFQPLAALAESLQLAREASLKVGPTWAVGRFRAFILQAPPWERSRRRSTLPEALRGMAATNSTRRGSLNEARMGFR